MCAKIHINTYAILYIESYILQVDNIILLQVDYYV